MLGEHVDRSGAEDFGIELLVLDRVEGGPGLEIFEAVAGDDERLAGLVEPVVGPADALEQARRALGRAHLDDEVDIAPVDPEIEARGADEAAKAAVGHRRFDLPAGLDRERAVVDSDRQMPLVRRPQILEDELGEASRVAEDQSRPVPLDLAHDVGRRPAARMARPGDPLVLGKHDLQVRLGARLALDDVDQLDVAVRGEPALIGFGIGDGGGKRDPAHGGRQALQPGQRQREEVAALAAGEGVDLVHHHRPEAGEEGEAVRVAEQQAERFRRGQEHLRRPHPLPRLAVGGGVPGPGLDPDRQVHLADRGQQIALDVDGERFERRDVEGVKALGRRLDQLDDRGEESGKGLAGAGRGDEQGASAGAGGGEHLELVSARGPAPGGEPGRDDGREIRHSGLDPESMNTAAPELSSAMVMDPDFRQDDAALRRPVVSAEPFLLFLAIEVAGALLAAVDVALVGLAVAEQNPEQDRREQQRPDDVDDSPTASATVHAFAPLLRSIAGAALGDALLHPI